MRPQINYFCFLFSSWAAPGARSDFGRSQSAPGALWELFEIIKSFQNQHFDALGALLGPQEPPKTPQDTPKTPKWSQNGPKMIGK